LNVSRSLKLLILNVSNQYTDKLYIIEPVQLQNKKRRNCILHRSATFKMKQDLYRSGKVSRR